MKGQRSGTKGQQEQLLDEGAFYHEEPIDLSWSLFGLFVAMILQVLVGRSRHTS